VQIDLAAALAWYKRAAGAGDREALHNVGWMYATGQGVKANQQEAYRWFLQAAQRGETADQFETARRLEEGEGVNKDLTLSYSWLLVLQAQQANFQPDDWGQVQSTLQTIERQLDGAAKFQAEQQSLKWMSAIAQNEMDAYSRQ
jgi:TPR repeat protein